MFVNSKVFMHDFRKQAVMQTPHFKFLESLVREIPLPPSAGSEVHWKTDLADQPSFSGFYPPGPATDSSCHMGISMLAAQIGLPKLPSSGNLLSTKRRQSNGEVDSNETKPKRGRPRKMKREEKCVDDDDLLLDEKPLSRVTDINELSNGTVLSDRELMPPPNVLPIRILASTAFMDNKRNSPSTSLLSSSKMNNNSEQRQSAV
ncbi:unnamed protein product [Brugia timori]|uniref:ULP_PROTEASE domain-containing protein n=1 Tax=Brugia timori TaxID=42155 RepID=A0A0R3R264_9BILA|nr:unnamed protein product [Brugia timori]